MKAVWMTQTINYAWKWYSHTYSRTFIAVYKFLAVLFVPIGWLVYICLLEYKWIWDYFTDTYSWHSCPTLRRIILDSAECQCSIEVRIGVKPSYKDVFSVSQKAPETQRQVLYTLCNQLGWYLNKTYCCFASDETFMWFYVVNKFLALQYGCMYVSCRNLLPHFVWMSVSELNTAK